MTTIAIEQSQTKSVSGPQSLTAVIYSHIAGRYNKTAVLSIACALLFVLYFIIPHTGVFHSLFGPSILYVIFAPLLAFSLSIISLRQILRTHDRGMFFGVAALTVSSLYFIAALAIPFVLLGCYILYAYLLR